MFSNKEAAILELKVAILPFKKKHWPSWRPQVRDYGGPEIESKAAPNPKIALLLRLDASCLGVRDWQAAAGCDR